MDSKRNENLYKVYLATFESFKKNAYKKDKYYKELKDCYTVLKETPPADFCTEESLKKFSEFLVFALETTNLKLIEKSLLTVDYIISHELIDSNTLQEIIKNILTHLYGKSMLNDDNINYKILNLCIIIYSSKLISVNGGNLINIIKVCLNIFLSSKNQNCQNMAKLTLIQIVENLIVKLDMVFYHNYNIKYGYNLQSRHSAPKQSTININMPTDENTVSSVKEYYKGDNMSNEYNHVIGKYMSHYVDIIEINSLKSENWFLEKISNIFRNSYDTDLTNDLIKILEDQNLENWEQKNENDQKIGKYGWCINCRGQANFFSEKINFPICSNECEVEVFRLHKLIDIDITIDSTNYRDDFINTLKILSKLSIRESKQQNYFEHINLRLREFCLELIQTLISKGAKYFLNENKLIQVIKESTMDSLIKNTLSNEMNIFKLSVNLFLTIISNFREHIVEEIEIFINRVLIAILESENLGFVYKEIILDSLVKLAENCNFLVEIYINYDCDINHKNIFSDLLNLMTKIIQGLYKKPKYSNTFKPLQEASLRIKCLDFLTSFIRNLSRFVEENNISYTKSYSGNMGAMTPSNNITNFGTSSTMRGFNLNLNLAESQAQSQFTQQEFLEDELNASIFNFESSNVDLKDKINQNIKMKNILQKAIDKFNINPTNGFNYLKAHDWLPTESSFSSIKEKLISSFNNTTKESKIYNEENMEQVISDVKSNSSLELKERENKERDSIQNSAMLSSNFFYNYSYVMGCMDLPQLQLVKYEDFYAKEIARFLRSNLKDINRNSLGEFICGSKELNKKVLLNFIEGYTFRNFHVLEAMRILLSDFSLAGESQIVDRVVQMFGQKYHKDNPTAFKNPDVAYYIGFSIMMLNTDLHRDEVGEKMPLKKFISNVYLLCNKEDIDESYLIDVYSRVLNNPLIIPGQRLNIHNKNKKDLIKQEKESILKSTFEELQNKNLISNNYITVIDNDHIKNLIDSSWSNFLGIFSQLLADFEEENIVNTCIDNILIVARMSGILRLDTIAEAFINTIINMTNIMEGREIKQKNCDCAKSLVDFAVQSGVYIRTCWFNILNVISKIDYYHTIGGQFKTEAENFAKEIRRRSKLRNPEKEIEIEFKNTDIVCRNISIIFCDNIFSKTAQFDEEGIVNFVGALCKVSKNELELFFNPRNYSLHKLVEVADFNIFRIQIEWGKIWKLLSDHLVHVATTYNHDNICNDAIDSLRQIVTKLLQKSDLAVYNFQIDFFKPFEIIFNQSINRPDRSELILTCLAFIVQNSKNIHSGWIIIFNILKQGLKRKDNKINAEILKILQTISEDFSLFSNINQEVFRGYIECLCHMYLEENLKKLAFETILKLMAKIFSNMSSNTSCLEADKKFEFLKIFFYGFDDLLKINVIEHLNLLFEVIYYNRDVIFSSDINSFIYVFYCYFKPHIVTLLLYYFEYRLGNFEINNSNKDNFINLHQNKIASKFQKLKKLEKLSNFPLPLNDNSIFKEFNTKNTIDDIYHNTKVYLEDSLTSLVKFLESEEDSTNSNFNFSNNYKFFELSKNGGAESKKLITNFLKTIIKYYDRDSDLIIKKLEILKNFELQNYEIALEFFLEKFLTMINKISDSYMNYRFFYEDLLSTLLNLSLFNKHSEIIFKILGKNILAVGSELSNSCWMMISHQVEYIIDSFASIKINISENNFNGLLSFIYSFSIFFRDLILNFYSNLSGWKGNVLLDEYRYLNTIFFKILSIDIENEFPEYRVIDSTQTLEILKTFSKSKFIILEKSPVESMALYYDNSTILTLQFMNKIYSKYNLGEEEKSEFVHVIEFELQNLLPKFLKYLNSAELEVLFNDLVDLVDTQNSQLRYSAKFLLKQFSKNKIIKFIPCNESIKIKENDENNEFIEN